jgi:hypothetical protein
LPSLLIDPLENQKEKKEKKSAEKIFKWRRGLISIHKFERGIIFPMMIIYDPLVADL